LVSEIWGGPDTVNFKTLQRKPLASGLLGSVLLMLLGGGTERKVAFVFHCRRSCRLPSSNFPSVCMDRYRVNVYRATLPSRPFFLLNSCSVLTVWDTFTSSLERCSTFPIIVGLFFLSRFNAASSILCDNWLRYSKNCEECVLIDTSLGEIGHKIFGMKLLWNIYSDYLVENSPQTPLGIWSFSEASHAISSQIKKSNVCILYLVNCTI